MRRGSRRKLKSMRRKSRRRLESMRNEDVRRNARSSRRFEIMKGKWLHYTLLLTTNPPQLQKGLHCVAHTRKMTIKCSQIGSGDMRPPAKSTEPPMTKWPGSYTSFFHPTY